MDDRQIREYIKEEVDFQREIASMKGEKVSRKEIIELTLVALEIDGKISSRQFAKFCKLYKI